MSKAYALEIRSSQREDYLKVFLRDNGEKESEEVRQLLSKLKSVRAANITLSQSSSHPGNTLTVYGKTTFDIKEVQQEVDATLTSYFGNNQSKPFEKKVSLEAKFKGIESQILNELDKANAMIDVCVAWFTNPILAQKLKDKANKGVVVRVIVNDDYTNQKHGMDFSDCPNIECKRVKADMPSGIMHQKFCVVDNNNVITGSYNWSKNAELKNDETIQTISNNTEIASKYTREFNRQWNK